VRFQLIGFDAARALWVEQERLVAARETIVE
jgi:hypothetical protein